MMMMTTAILPKILWTGTSTGLPDLGSSSTDFLTPLNSFTLRALCKEAKERIYRYSREVSQAMHTKGTNCLVNTKQARYNTNSKPEGLDHSPKDTAFCICGKVMITIVECKSTNIRGFQKEN
jgi:hypothetical protein